LEILLCARDAGCLPDFGLLQTKVKARLLLIEKLKAAVASGVEESVVHEDRRSSTPSLEEDEESWATMAKRRKVERQKELRATVGIQPNNEVEDLVHGLLYSDLQDTACLKWWQENEASFLAKGPAGKALIALAKRCI